MQIMRLSGSVFDANQQLDTNLDEPLGHSVMLDLKGKIEKACSTLGYDIRGGVSIGMLYGKGVEATQQSVMMTDMSVIMMTDHLHQLINRVAKLLALTIPFEIEGEQFRICEDISEVILSTNKNMVLRGYWAKMFIDYAENPVMPHVGEAVIVTGAQRQTMWSDLTEAMELFVVGHEYAHHILKHSLDGTASALGEAAGVAHKAETEADILGLMLSMNAGHDIDPPNIFAVYGIGAVAILSAMEYCRRGERLLRTGTLSAENTRDTHPALAARLTCLVKVVPELMKGYGPDQTIVVNRMHYLFARTIELAWESASGILSNAHREGARPITEVSSGWLP